MYASFQTLPASNAGAMSIQYVIEMNERMFLLTANDNLTETQNELRTWVGDACPVN
jgi:hypothetical protein